MNRSLSKLAAAAMICAVLAGASERAAGQGAYVSGRLARSLAGGSRPGASLAHLALVIDSADNPIVARLAYARALQLDPYSPQVRAAMVRRSGSVGRAFQAGAYRPGPTQPVATGGPVARGGSILGQTARRLGTRQRSIRWRISRLRYALRQRPRRSASQPYYPRYTWGGGVWWPRAEPMGIRPEAYWYRPAPAYYWPGAGAWREYCLRATCATGPRPRGYGRRWGVRGVVIHVGR